MLSILNLLLQKLEGNSVRSVCM